LSTFVAFDIGDLFGSSCDLLVFNHALSQQPFLPRHSHACPESVEELLASSSFLVNLAFVA
jgi:hypothetical protein